MFLARIFCGPVIFAMDFCQKENTKPINWQAAVSGGGGEPIQDVFPSLCTSRRTLFVAIQLGVKNKIKTLTLNSLTLTRPRTHM